MPVKKKTSSEKELKKGDLQKLENLEKSLSYLAQLLEQIGVNDFVRYISSGRRVFWMNFWAGVSRGFGVVIGMTVVFTVVLWVLSYMVNFPYIGQYFIEVKQLLESLSGQIR